MEYIALTGIADSLIEVLKRHHLRTLEIRSPQNFVGVLGLNAGDSVLLTSTSLQDLTDGTQGLIAKVLQKQVSVHSVVSSNELYIEEREAMSARIQLECKCVARIKNVISNELGKPVRVDAREISCYEAR
ncbi:MAG: DUF473 domain-containing protein [Methanosarcina thermophila]|mgnify:CR=1 FL=1|jgi:hypothetical protein|uniref:DUF473 domain-containing protein n=3 Tax=Methanosarcina thermophila TaxID=2210 RepID=A0A1I6X2Y0_METTE|nr:DUF473 domain-containing protein [Methanosarcina thermophila]ALK04781.1 MAG: hypothetical protein AAY43_02565 [Methanosarcina sp. 795]AKB13490.1 hypothetical protein MSTHT_1732 [Methanosarcina thermophila TM-1]AKB15874.1 hypothetical protein MSTHC_1556 [Methanosarcina thermophila CHTI-55]NLU56567.1 DUF473 family protein [Methanosarcina thermophila]SFT32174.1 hypothetical protein SAMN02910340_00066 [Methanosarcina thermophila]